MFCFTDNKIINIIHYTYIIILVILNFYFTFYIISHEVCCKNKEENDAWEEEENTSCFNPLLNRLIYYPFAQIISLSGPIYYRIYRMKSISPKKEEDNSLIDAAGICAILNCFSTFLHTFIFALSNNLLNCNKNEESIENQKPLFKNDNDD